jgi:hypothetical protein
MCSMWRDDSARRIVDRVEHLLSKAESYPNLAWRWIVGDSTDDTAETLRQLSTGYDVEVLDIGSTGIEGDDADSRLRRLSLTANHYLYNVKGYDYILCHESDLLSPPDLVNRMVANAERGICPIAAWPVIELRGKVLCYDVWALRKDGVRFMNRPPYHPCYRADKPFLVDSFGSVFMFHAEDAAECIMSKRAVLDLCWHLRELGRDLYVDPAIVVRQPVELWEYHHIEKEYA